MRSVPSAWLSKLASGDLSLVTWWKISRRDGVVLRGTENTRDLDIVLDPDPFNVTGTYSARRGMTASNMRSTGDMSVDNLEARGALKADVVFDDISAEDLEAGLYDKAAVTFGRVDWKQPDAGVVIDARGWLGNITRDTDGNWRCEIRTLLQALSQVQGRSYGLLCDADLFDARCGLNKALHTTTGIVTSVTDQRAFEGVIDVGSPPFPSGYFKFGWLEFTTGANAGYGREVAEDSAGGDLGGIEVFEAFPKPIAEDDEFEISAGCNKELNILVEMKGNSINPNGPPTIENGRVTGDCAVKFSNAANHRGFVNKPGPDTMIRLRTPKRKSGGSGGGGKL